MPIMNGLEALTIISKDFPKIKVVMVSFEGTDAFMAHCINKDAKAYFLKGSHESLLFETIDKVLTIYWIVIYESAKSIFANQQPN